MFPFLVHMVFITESAAILRMAALASKKSVVVVLMLGECWEFLLLMRCTFIVEEKAHI